jgi:hypothetical protein
VGVVRAHHREQWELKCALSRYKLSGIRNVKCCEGRVGRKPIWDLVARLRKA